MVTTSTILKFYNKICHNSCCVQNSHDFPIFVFVPVFVLVLVLVLQQAATYSIAAVAGNWTILVGSFVWFSSRPIKLCQGNLALTDRCCHGNENLYAVSLCEGLRAVAGSYTRRLLARALQALSDPICCSACLCVCVWHFLVNFNAKYLGNKAI